ncbi:alcohol dehydrogenase [Klebsiella pneumoniae]|uniref:Alcohol dehydrogenase n=1 Tax=Klebsiella pneumoniae TaxID=573 RepID=A0A377W2I5_KLEPN|nr:alcohol dehydrogenase [Klebsiella pneumoniae]
MAVTNIAELNALVERVKKAQREYASFTQEQVDKNLPRRRSGRCRYSNPSRQNGRSRIRHGHR